MATGGERSGPYGLPAKALAGRTALVTGATSGIGRVAARALAELGAELVLVARSRQRGEATLAEIGERVAGGRASLLLGDLASQRAVRQLAERFLESGRPLHLLVNNAGVLLRRRRETEEGVEATVAVNHLAPFLLTRLLLERLRESAPARIVNVSSGAHRWAEDGLDFEDLEARRRYRPLRQYGATKLANLLFTRELARRLEGSGVTANALHPGFVATRFATNNGALARAALALARPFARTPEQGAETLVHLCAAPELEGASGRYFVDRRERRPAEPARRDADARRLWEWSARRTGLPPEPEETAMARSASDPAERPGAAAPEPEPAWHGLDPRDGDPERRDDPFPALHHLRAVAPVNETPLGFWRLSRYEDCVRLLREVPGGVRLSDGRRLVERPGPGGGPGGEFMLQQDPPAHTRLRKLVSKAFTPRAARSWRPRAEEVAAERLEAAFERAPGPDGRVELDVIEALALPVPSTLICEMLGVPVEDRPRFTRWTADATHGLAGELADPEARERAAEGAAALARYFEELLEARRRDLRDDLLSVLIRAEEDGDRLSPSELLVQSIGLLIAGFETTIGLIGNGVRALARHPEEQERLRREPALAANAVEECLRYDGPIGATTRILHADAVFGGRTIPKDTPVWALLRAANRDPERFPDPDRFRVDRPEAKEHLAFGGGTHHCLGAHLARMEAQVAIGSLVARTRSIELASEGVEWGRSLFRVPGRLPVRVLPA